MYFSEAQETIEWLKSNDVVAVLDWVLDTLWVGIWTLHKMGLNAEQIVQAFEEISRSNYTKIAWWVIRNEQGKIIKPEWYEPPNLLPIVQGR
jgi:predicted HAD superfamily Cof-like phosphohydrolase